MLIHTHTHSYRPGSKPFSSAGLSLVWSFGELSMMLRAEAQVHVRIHKCTNTSMHACMYAPPPLLSLTHTNLHACAAPSPHKTRFNTGRVIRSLLSETSIMGLLRENFVCTWVLKDTLSRDLVKGGHVLEARLSRCVFVLLVYSHV